MSKEERFSLNVSAIQSVINIGNGDYQKGVNLVAELAERLAHARAKHDWKGYKPLMGWEAISHEVTELWDAICTEMPERAHDEALDVAVTAIRFLLEEWT